MQGLKLAAEQTVERVESALQAGLRAAVARGDVGLNVHTASSESHAYRPKGAFENPLHD